MSTRVVGKLDDWDDADLGGNDFMNLEEGNNPVRLISKPYQFYIHWTKDEAGANRKVRCALDGCPVCETGDRGQTRWYVAVINRKKERCAIIEIGPQIYKGILSLKSNKKWGNPRNYDIDIVRRPKGSQPLYVPTPEPPTDLSEEEVEMAKEFLARVDMVRLIEPSTPEDLREKLGMPAVTGASSVDNDFDDDVPVESDESNDDDDFDF